MEFWQIAPSILALFIALATFAYAAGALRQRVHDLERRMEQKALTLREQNDALREIRDRVIAIDEWRKVAANTHSPGSCPFAIAASHDPHPKR